MNIPDASFAVLEELKRMREEGVREIYLEEETLLHLEKKLKPLIPVTPAAPMSKPQPKKALDLPPSSTNPVSKETNTVDIGETTPPLVTEAPPKTITVEGASVSDDNDAKFVTPPSLTLPEGDKRTKWKWLENEVNNCSVSNSEINPDGQIIFGRGDLDAELFFCGESPNDEDEKAGSAFGGPAGELLGKIIEAMGFPVPSVYISNILHWKPKHDLAFGHRPPSQAELQFAMPYLKAQLEIVQPKVIISLGKIATDGFLGFDSKRRLGDVRGNWNEYEGIPLMVTYHPSYLLHNPSKSGKRKVWEDMLKVMEKVEVSISEKQQGFFL
ncbi:MAG: uracil-DNA glycosylase [Opitutales bacterium]|nr:uracil-DNA glycosylase [Opitutales bacterium]